MKNYILLLILITSIFYACSDAVVSESELVTEDNQMTIPKKPGAIVKDPVDLNCNINSEFTFKVKPVRWADSYTWTIAKPELIEILSGQGTNEIKVRVPGKACEIPAQIVSVTATNSLGTGKARVFYGEILVTKPRLPEPAPTIEGYKIKLYGTKTWMVENLSWGGLNDDLGSPLVDDNAQMVKDFGRFYTWYEAMTGLPECSISECPYEAGYAGVDDAGNPFVMDGTTKEYNLQIQGICPQGWHIANLYDWYDLLVAIKTEYSIPDDLAKAGYKMSYERDQCYNTEKNLARAYENNAQCGGVGAWLRGGKRILDGGYWNNKNLTYKAGGITYPLFADGAEEIGFNYLPTGRIVKGEYKDGGKYGYCWLPTNYTPDGGKALPYTIGATNTNLSSYQRDKTEQFVVRCVKNY